MKSFIAILKLTLRIAVRSNIFILLFLLLNILVIIIPSTVVDDGTPEGHIRVSLEYCLASISFILTISTIWVGCFIASGDIENYQMHMLAVKPVSRVKIWLAKFAGVFLLHFVLLLISGVTVYGRILYEYNRKSYTEEEKAKIENEVLVGRRVYMPVIPSMEEAVRKEYEQRLKTQKELGLEPGKQVNNPNDPMNSEASREFQLRKDVYSKMGEVPYGPSGTRMWEYKGIRKVSDNPMFVRYRLYVDKLGKKDQRETMGQWFAKIKTPPEVIEQMRKEDPKMTAENLENVFVPVTPYPEKLKGGAFIEFVLPPEVLGKDGTAMLAYANMDVEKKPVFFQLADGPKLLVKVTGFFENYFRGLLMISIKLAFLAALSCALGGIFSMPVAVFFCICYILVGVFSGYLIFMEEQYEEGMEQKFTLNSLEEVHDYVGKKVSRFVLATTVPVQRLGVSDQLADGELVEYSYIAKVFFIYFMLKGLPFFALCVWLYRKRELGAVTRR